MNCEIICIFLISLAQCPDGETEVLVDVAANNCEETCDGVLSDCTEEQIQKCICKKGYVRNSERKCIPYAECPQKCPENEILSYGPSIVCQSNCYSVYSVDFATPVDPDGPIDRAAPVGPEKCAYGPFCKCKDNYIRLHPKGPCVDPKKCPMVCLKRGETVTDDCEMNCNGVCIYDDTVRCKCKKPLIRQNGECVGNCSCKSPEIFGYDPTVKYQDYCGVSMCIEGDCEYGLTCKCPEGYIRSTPEGDCIPIENCPQICPEPQVYVEVDSTNNCETDCAGNVFCIPVKTRACRCLPPFVRDGKRCIKKEQCPIVCPLGELPNYKPYTYCERFCPNKTVCFDTIRNCTCPPGSIRSYEPNGPCIESTKCEVTCTKPKESFYGPVCDRYCNGSIAECADGRSSKCLCPDHLRDSNHKCIDPCECCPDIQILQTIEEHELNCEPTCDGDLDCTKDYFKCVCPPGKLWDKDAGKCIEKRKCKPRCQYPLEPYQFKYGEECIEFCSGEKYSCGSDGDWDCVCKKPLKMSVDGKCVDCEECDHDRVWVPKDDEWTLSCENAYQSCEPCPPGTIKDGGACVPVGCSDDCPLPRRNILSYPYGCPDYPGCWCKPGPTTCVDPENKMWRCRCPEEYHDWNGTHCIPCRSTGCTADAAIF